MLSNMNILIIGGDARYLSLMENLRLAGANLYLIGYERMPAIHVEVSYITIKTANFEDIDAIILPVSGVDENGVVRAEYARDELKLTEAILAKTKASCTIYSGVINEYLRQITSRQSRKLVDLFANDDLAIYNSVPTAEGTLKVALEETDYTIHGSNVLFLGFGRVGFTTARLFQNVGANVFVAARKPDQLARVFEMRMTPISLSEVNNHLAKMNICINTIQHPIITKEMLEQMSKHTLIIDIASADGGTDFAAANTLGIKAIHALGLPGKTAPKSAGAIISRVILPLLEQQYKTATN